MIQTMRWFGPNDPVELPHLLQAGCTGVVTALHQIPVGEIWTQEAIQERIQLIARHPGLQWLVVESLPVHEDIKKGLPSRDQYIQHYQTSLRNLAAAGIRTVCYNFMPVLDWSRTDLVYELPNGAKTLRFVWQDFAVFDLCILKRPNAAQDYSPEVQAEALWQFERMTDAEKQKLQDTVLLGLPGSEEAFSLDSFQSLLDAYATIGDAELRQNLYYFIQQVAPVAEDCGINLCIHPDDPPRPLLGLPRVVSTAADLQQLLDACPVRANGLTFCTGSLGVRPDNLLPTMFEQYADRIHFIHLRSTKREEQPLNFHEADHLYGDVDMYAVVKAIVQEEQRRAGAGYPDARIPFRPDHGHQMLDDLSKKTYPGYSAIGRVKGLAEIRGLELAIRRSLAFLLICLWSFSALRADDGYRLWLKYDLIQNPAQQASYLPFTQYLACAATDPIAQTAVLELQQGLEGLLGKKIRILRTNSAAPGGISLELNAPNPQADLGQEGFRIVQQNGRLIIRANRTVGLLYGAFELLRKIQTLTPIAQFPTQSRPRIQLRMLNHWDNTNGSIERGYAGASLWKWYELPENLDPRYTDYARANASIGINSVVLNNVNASARFMSREYLLKVKALAEVFRPYGIRVYLSVNFASPRILGKLKTSDPLDPGVRQWWQEKAQEIYRIIPDFGGFLVKANSEGEPGPQDYGRNHADGANMLAEALAPHQGIVIWRAFVYKPDPKGDRFKAAFEEFKPLDGQFLPNVVVQVKNGPIDFQPREPFHPLFGAMPKTPLAMEFQLTQEYLGFSTNLVYLAPLFKECLDADTHAQGSGAAVAKVIDGTLHQYPISVIAGVANTGSDRNWCGHLMAQANWYAFGRLAWDHQLSSKSIAEEWTKMTLSRHPRTVSTVCNIMERSREVYVDFTTPLGLHHIMGQNIHFGPEPWLERSARPDWTSIYYHRADSIGLGFDRGPQGSNALALYHPGAAAAWSNAETCPLPFLLWFHHVPWNKKLRTGRTLWEELCTRYYTGVDAVAGIQKEWASLKGSMDEALHNDVAGRLAVQYREAQWWRDACVLYFQQYAKQPIPAAFPPPTRTLEEIKQLVQLYQLR